MHFLFVILLKTISWRTYYNFGVIEKFTQKSIDRLLNKNYY